MSSPVPCRILAPVRTNSTPVAVRRLRRPAGHATFLAGLGLAVILSAGVTRAQLPATTNAPFQAVLTNEEWAWLTGRSNTLVVGVDPSWAVADPELDPKTRSGMEMDFARRVAEKVGASLRIYPAKDWNAVLAAARSGEVDFLAALRRTPDKEAEWLFTEPYMDIPVVILVKKTQRESLTVEEMSHLRLAVGHKYAVDEFVATSYPMLTVTPIKSDLDGILDLSVGDLDVLIIDLATASQFIEQHNIANLRIAGRVGPHYEFSMACSHAQPMAFAVISKGLAAIDESDRKTIRDKWLRFQEQPFYRNRLFWLWVGGSAVCVLAVLLVVVGWNTALKRKVEQTTRALVQELAERRRTESELSRAHSELELRVRERTAELADANRQLEREVAERRQAEREVLEISSHERKRIGRDLHDSLGQQLAGVSLLSEALAQRMSESQAAEATTARKISTLINESIAHAKYIVRGLMPVEIVQEGLRHALKRLAEETARISSVTCSFDSDGPSPVYDNDVATNLYRIAQEAVANAVKHGKARHLALRLTADGHCGQLEILDDGRGLPQQQPSTTGLGLPIMRYRAEMCGGEFRIENRPEGGVRVRCTFRDHPPANADSRVS